jgi:predicted metal-binding protein
MSKNFKELESHFFICTHSREDRASCAGRGSMELASDLKSWVKDNDLKTKIKITKSGCLGLCEEGIAAVCYPEGRWYTHVKPTDIEALKNDLK